MDMGLAGKKAIILGGSRGIGWYTADLMRDEGAEIAICARGAEGVQEAVEKLQAKGQGPVFGRAANLEDGEETQAFVRDAIAALGGVDILIHNASGFDMEGDEDGWKRSFEVDIMAGVRAVEEAIPALEESDAASITLIGSMASKFFLAAGHLMVRPRPPCGPMPMSLPKAWAVSKSAPMLFRLGPFTSPAGRGTSAKKKCRIFTVVLKNLSHLADWARGKNWPVLSPLSPAPQVCGSMPPISLQMVGRWQLSTRTGHDRKETSARFGLRNGHAAGAEIAVSRQGLCGG